jgi:methanogenic corrinoid protein MtbC1
VGVSAGTLRAWENRYGLLQPDRTQGNYRLYTADDEARVRRALAYMEQGMSTAEAARLALATRAHAPVEDDTLEQLKTDLLEALEGFDEPAAQGVLDRLFALVTVERALRDVVLPVLHEIGERWAQREISVAEEHYATNLLQARLQALAAGWQSGTGPAAVLACLPGELHSIGLACLGLGLRTRGWTVFYLGQDTPLSAIEETAERVSARVLVLAAALPQRFAEMPDEPLRLPPSTSIAVGGRGASRAAADRLDARLLEGDPLTAAETLTTALR